jgi:hypothetical protein
VGRKGEEVAIGVANLLAWIMPAVGGQHLMGIVKRVQGQPDLFQMIAALHAGGGLAHLLDGRKQQADEQGDDAQDNEQFDQSEGTSHGRPRFTSPRDRPDR